MRIDNLRFLVVEDHGFQRWAVSNMLDRSRHARDGRLLTVFEKELRRVIDFASSYAANAD